MLNNGRDATVAALAVAAALSGGYIILKWQQKRSEQPPPVEKWRHVGSLKELVCYPIKSCAAVKLESMHCALLGLSKGFMRDRIFVVINSEGNFESARALPQLVLIEPRFDGEYLILSAPGMDNLRVHLPPLQDTVTATVHGQTVPAADCGDAASQWICRYLQREGGGYRLAYHPNTACRRGFMDRKQFPKMKIDDGGAFGDLSSYNIINEASVEDLNDRLRSNGKDTVDAKVFRGNFIVNSGKPYEEDNWNWIKIGDTIFRGVAPCTRCLMTTLNYRNGTLHPKREPLVTLKTYRSIDGPSPTMGLHLAIHKQGTVKVGDPVYVA